MNWSPFEIRVPGKWVLSGEHAVLRGATAIALPHPEFGLKLRFKPEPTGALKVLPESASQVVHDLLAAIQDDREQNGQSFVKPAGALEIESTIPIGAGLGSSAALCVAMTRWLAGPLGLREEQICEFATQLEHRFHGQSSGMDVAVIAAAKPVSFIRGRGATPLDIRKTPRFTFHDTGIRTRTSDCVIKVEQLREEFPTEGMQIDEAMSAASRHAMEGLVRFDGGDSAGGLELIARSMREAQDCYYRWQLVPGAAKRLEDELLAKGALAVKITGAGGGGMLVALWGSGGI